MPPRPMPPRPTPPRPMPPPPRGRCSRRQLLHVLSAAASVALTVAAVVPCDSWFSVPGAGASGFLCDADLPTALRTCDALLRFRKLAAGFFITAAAIAAICLPPRLAAALGHPPTGRLGKAWDRACGWHHPVCCLLLAAGWGVSGGAFDEVACGDKDVGLTSLSAEYSLVGPNLLLSALWIELTLSMAAVPAGLRDKVASRALSVPGVGAMPPAMRQYVLVEFIDVVLDFTSVGLAESEGDLAESPPIRALLWNLIAANLAAFVAEQVVWFVCRRVRLPAPSVRALTAGHCAEDLLQTVLLCVIAVRQSGTTPLPIALGIAHCLCFMLLKLAVDLSLCGFGEQQHGDRPSFQLLRSARNSFFRRRAEPRRPAAAVPLPAVRPLPAARPPPAARSPAELPPLRFTPPAQLIDPPAARRNRTQSASPTAAAALNRPRRGTAGARAGNPSFNLRV
eukprot:TRINITY_DN13047_c0_g1_i1.p2 TRINITY_DN13047_c0_g1~~TRINITY_DN13047_c0_g1_i1.p2  ORF type:complete len:452 (+),score=124.38 TRINITY_DN13047_c0_g1_i1:48-1403(+)